MLNLSKITLIVFNRKHTNFSSLTKARRLLQSLAWFALITSMSQSLADSYHVLPTSGDTINPETRSAIRELIISSLLTKGHQVKDQMENSDFDLQSQAIQVGKSILVILQKISNGRVLTSEQMKAKSADELDLVVGRLVSAAVSEQRVENTVQIGAISEKEMTEVERRTKSRHFTLSGIGPFAFYNLKTDLIGYHLALGDIREVTPQAGIRTMFEGSFRTHDLGGSESESAYLAALSIGGIYYFRNASTSPFLAAGLGYGGAYSSNTDTAWGMTFGTELGVAWFRTASSQLQLSVKYLFLSSKNEEGYPQTLGISLSILQ